MKLSFKFKPSISKKQLEIVKNKLTKSRELNKIKLKKINS